MNDERYKVITAALAIILAAILVSGGVFSYLNRSYIAAWYRRVTSDEAVVSPFFEQRVQAFSVEPEVVPDGRALVFVGDSFIETFPWSEHFSDQDDLVVLNRGIYGDTIEGLAARFDVSFLVRRDPTIVLMVGINDIGVDSSCTGEFASSYADLLNRLIAGGMEGRRIFVNGLFPARRPDKSNDAIVSCNDELRRLTGALGVRYIDLFSRFAGPAGDLDPAYSLQDGLHLNADGYRMWLEIIREHLSTQSDPTPRFSGEGDDEG